MMVDIQTYDYFHNESNIRIFEQRFGERINNQLGSVWIKFEEFFVLESLDDSDSLTFEIEDCEDKYLYSERHFFLCHNKLKIEKPEQSYRIVWHAASEGPNLFWRKS